MLIHVKGKWLVSLGFALLLSACGDGGPRKETDGVVLDRFSRQYTDFLDAGADTESVRDFLTLEGDPTGFWTAFRGAIDSGGTVHNRARLIQAQAAISLYDKWIVRGLDGADAGVQSLDKLVLRLIETANAIRNAEYREGAVRVAEYAREVQAQYSAGGQLAKRRLRLQRRWLEFIVAAQGDFVQAAQARTFKASVEEATTITRDLEDTAQQSVATTHKLKDAFAALKGKSGMKAYPTRGEIEEQTPSNPNKSEGAVAPESRKPASSR